MNTTDPQPFELETSAGTRVQGFLDLPAGPPDGAAPHRAVVVCHGFKGFMEWGFFPPLAELLRDRGFAVVRFNFSGSGMQPGEDRVSDTDAFRADTHALEVEELDSVLSAVGGPIGGARIAPGPVGLLGHSRGGGVAVLAAAGRTTADGDTPEPRVGALVTWAAIATIDRLTDDQKDLWRRVGELEVINGRTGQRLALGPDMLAEVEGHGGRLDPVTAAPRIECPWLIVHGAADETVPMADADALAEAAGNSDRGEHELLRIEGGGHTFGAVHPFAGPTRELTAALNATQSWFRRHLG